MEEKNEVHIALEILVEEIEAVINRINEEGARAFQVGDYETVHKSAEMAKRVQEFREKVKALQQEWDRLFAPVLPPPRSVSHGGSKRIGRGLRTPPKAFRRPILEALVELGGSAPMSGVLEVVEQKMKGVLNPHDYEPLRSGGIRWRNTAQWCRHALIQEGLLRRDSPYGIWEITDRGRKALQSGEV